MDWEGLVHPINSPDETLPSEDCDSRLKGLPFGLHFGISLHLSMEVAPSKVACDLLTVKSIRSTVSPLFLDILVYVLKMRLFLTSLSYVVSLLASSLKYWHFLESHPWPTPLCSGWPIKVLTSSKWLWLSNLISSFHLSEEPLTHTHKHLLVIMWYPRGTAN